LALEPDTRSRIRVNGTAQHTADGILVTVEEAFGNCPKYIQRRVPAEALETPAGRPDSRSATGLDAGRGRADPRRRHVLHRQRPGRDS
jgi:hypothetical protein